jgi:hypothetical protein
MCGYVGDAMTRELVIDLDNYVGMRLVCEVLVARPDALPAAFPGWLQPLPHPVVQHLHNPFTNEPIYRDTGEPHLVTTCTPNGPWPDNVSCPNLDAFHHRDLAPIGHHEIAILARCISAPPNEILGALFVPPAYGWNLWAIPGSTTSALAEVSSTAEVSRTWLAALRVDPHVADDLLAQVDDWNACLVTLIELSRRALTESAQLFVYEGPTPHGRHAAQPGGEADEGCLAAR